MIRFATPPPDAASAGREDRRKVDLVAISDVHLGTRACRAADLLVYLQAIAPRRLLLVGDIIDGWMFSASGWPEQHTAILQELGAMLAAGTQIIYITGNHDDMLRRYSPMEAGNLLLCDEYELELGGKRTWFCHGDLLEHSVPTPRWMSRLGGLAFDGLAMADVPLNATRRRLGLGPTASVAWFKSRLPGVARHIRAYEDACAHAAAARGCAAVVTGHIHLPNLREVDVGEQRVTYLNCGDWVENCSALEWHDGDWSLVQAAGVGDVVEQRDMALA